MSKKTPTTEISVADIEDIKDWHRLTKSFSDGLDNTHPDYTPVDAFTEEGVYNLGAYHAFSDVLRLIGDAQEAQDGKKDHTKRNVALVFAAGAAVGFAFNSPAVGNFAKDVKFYWKQRRSGVDRETARRLLAERTHARAKA